MQKEKIMAMIKIIKNNYNEAYTSLVNFNGILLEYKQYKKYGRNLLVGKNSLTKDNVDVYDLDKKIVLSDGWMDVEKVKVYKNKDGYLCTDGTDENGETVQLTIHYLYEYTWLNSSKPADRYDKDPDGEVKYHITHENGDKENCSGSNIFLKYREENILDAYLQGYSNGHKHLSNFLLAIGSWPESDRKKEIYKNLGNLFLEWSKK
jgi:hypothetical protein